MYVPRFERLMLGEEVNENSLLQCITGLLLVF